MRNRIFSIGEKVIPGDGVVAAKPVMAALSAAAGKLVLFDTETIAGRSNAALFGAIAATGVLPLDEESCRRAIAVAGVAVDANIAVFDAGLKATRREDSRSDDGEVMTLGTAPASLAELVSQFPERLRPVVEHAVARHVDYQDETYARTYVDRLAAVYGADENAGGARQDFRLTFAVAPRLAAWMTVEDVIRVAQLKTRPGRLSRIREENGAAPDELVRVVDFLKPGRAELAGLLPAWIARHVPRNEPGQPRGGVALKITTSRPWGFVLLKLLAGLRPWRRKTAGYAEEQDAIVRWLEAVTSAAPRDYDLACRLVDLARWVRGYGDVRDRGLARMKSLCGEWRQKLDADPEALAAELGQMIEDARNHPDAGCAPVA